MKIEDKIILQKIANTIIVYMSDAQTPCLISGKMGICVFLYYYSSFFDNSVYEDIASDLLKEIFDEMEDSVAHQKNICFSEIGIGIIKLLSLNYIDDSEHSEILKNIDNIVLLQSIESFYLSNQYPHNLYFPGIYLLYRLKFYRKNFDMNLFDHFIDKVNSFLTSREKNDLFYKNKSLYCSFLCICLLLKYDLKEKDKRIDNIIRTIIKVLNEVDFDMYSNNKYIYFKLSESLNCIPKNIRLYETINNYISHLNYKNNFNTWCNDAWYEILYGINNCDILNKQYGKLIDSMITNFSFDLKTICQTLSGVGISLIFNNFKLCNYEKKV